MKPLPQDTETSVHEDAGVNGLLARLERYDRGASRAAPVPDEPLTPELVLVDPDLARRAREEMRDGRPEQPVDPDPPQLAVARSAAPPLPAAIFVEQTPPLRVGGRRVRRRRALRLLLVAALAAGAAAAVVRVEPLKRFFWQSRDATVLPRSPAGSSAKTSSTAQVDPKPPPTAAPAKKARGKRADARRRAPVPSAASARTFVWVPVANASSYLVEFFRRGRKIFRARPSSARLVVPAHWTFNGRRYTLAPGRYAWSVRPGYGSRARARYGPAVVRATLLIQRGSVG